MANRVQYGSMVLIASGLLTFVGLIIRGPTIDPSIDPMGYAQGAAAYTQAGFLLLPASVLQIIGVIVLYWYFSDGRARALVTWALVLSVVGIALFLPFAGGTLIPNATIGQLYEGGNTEVMQIAEATFSSPLALFLLFSSLVPYLAGYSLFGYLLWKLGGVMKLAGVALVLHAPLVTIVAAASYTGEVLGGMALFIAGAVLTWKLLRGPADTG